MGYVSIPSKIIPHPLFAGQKYNIIFENDCGYNCDTDLSNLDLNHLNGTFFPPSGQVYKEFKLPQGTKVNDIKNHLKHETEQCVRDDDDALKGSIFDPTVQRIMGRLNPCGMGYFGTSNGLDDNDL